MRRESKGSSEARTSNIVVAGKVEAPVEQLLGEIDWPFPMRAGTIIKNLLGSSPLCSVEMSHLAALVRASTPRKKERTRCLR